MTEKIYTDHYTPKPDLEWDCPEHYIPHTPKVPRREQVRIIQHKQNETIEKPLDKNKVE